METLLTDIIIIDATEEALMLSGGEEALKLLGDKAVFIDHFHIMRARISWKFWNENREILEAAGFKEIWPTNTTERRVPGAGI